MVIHWTDKQTYLAELKIDEKRKFENLIQPHIEKLTKAGFQM